jgi:ABC-type transport system involved in cytochrome c biogenesis permease component
MRAIRWLLVKDLRILWRSPVTTAVLIVYPAAVALLIGFALSRGSDKPTVALVDQVPRGEEVTIGNERLGPVVGRKELEKRVQVDDVSSRRQAERKVRDGDALAALVIPADAIRKAESQVESTQVELLVNEEDPVKGQLVDDAIASVVAAENRRLSRALVKTNLQYLKLLLEGGRVSVLGNEFTVLGLRRIGQITRAARRALPARSPVRPQLEQVIRFNQLALENFGIGGRALSAVGEPIKVKKVVLSGTRVPLTSFAAALAVAVSLMFVTVLLAAGALALERTENAFARLVRGPVSRTALLAEKVLLAAGVGVVVTLLMVLVLGAFVDLEWGRFELWFVALLVGGAAFGAFGVALGAVAREVSAASLLAFAALLPLVFCALVPSGVVSPWLYDLTRIVSAAFPFKPALKAVEAAFFGDGALIGPLFHLLGLGIAFALAARLALRRFAS